MPPRDRRAKELYEYFRRGVAWGASEAQGWPLYRSAFVELVDEGWVALKAGRIVRTIDALRDPPTTILAHAIRDACIEHPGYDEIARAVLADPRLKIEVRDVDQG